jgi:ribosome-interacting GTPase 1
VIEGNRIYIPAIYAVNKIDQVRCYLIRAPYIFNKGSSLYLIRVRVAIYAVNKIDQVCPLSS